MTFLITIDYWWYDDFKMYGQVPDFANVPIAFQRIDEVRQIIKTTIFNKQLFNQFAATGMGAGFVSDELSFGSDNLQSRRSFLCLHIFGWNR